MYLIISKKIHLPRPGNRTGRNESGLGQSGQLENYRKIEKKYGFPGGAGLFFYRRSSKLVPR